MTVTDAAVRAGSRMLDHAPRRLRRSYRVRRAGRRMAGRRAGVQQVPERPIGAKLELTYHCNLRCAFCYTDSPRRTLARTAEMDDDAWRRIIDDAIELGVIEAVVTGGEPLLRRDLTLWTVDRLSEAGVMVTMNTNGWFCDAEIADRLAATNARIHVSLDGASPELHDASRGVPGSWRRATDAVAMLLDRGVRVQVVHVVTPRNEATLPEFLDQMRVLGPSSVRVVAVGRIGAAARSGQWDIDYARMIRLTGDFGTPARPRILGGSDVPGTVVATDLAPRAFLVRPNGAFMADSNHPFSFGHAGSQTLAECWQGLRDSWRGERVESWRAGAKSPAQVAAGGLVPYLDEEEAVAGVAPGVSPTKKSGSDLKRALDVLATKAPDFPGDGRGAIEAASDRIAELSLGRRYRQTPSRWGGDRDGRRLVRVLATGKVHALNASAGIVLDQLDDGSVAGAAEALRAANPGLAPERAQADALDTAMTLLEKGVVVPALAPRDDSALSAEDGSLDGLPD